MNIYVFNVLSVYKRVQSSQTYSKAGNDFYQSSESQISIDSKNYSTFNGMNTDTLISYSKFVWILNCNFQYFNMKSDGGALRYWQDGGKLLVENSKFSNCKSEAYGGAVFADYGDCVLNCVSSNNCSGLMGSFIFVGYSYSQLINIKTLYEAFFHYYVLSFYFRSY